MLSIGSIIITICCINSCLCHLQYDTSCNCYHPARHDTADLIRNSAVVMCTMTLIWQTSGQHNIQNAKYVTSRYTGEYTAKVNSISLKWIARLSFQVRNWYRFRAPVQSESKNWYKSTQHSNAQSDPVTVSLVGFSFPGTHGNEYSTHWHTRNNQVAYRFSFSKPTMVLLKPHLGVSGVPFINSMIGARPTSPLIRSSRLGRQSLADTDGNIVWNSPLATSSFMMSRPPTSSPLIYSCGYVGQFEYSFKPA